MEIVLVAMDVYTCSYKARRFHIPHLQNRAQFGKAIEEQIVSKFLVAHGFQGRQERFHFLLRHRPTSAFPRHGNPRTQNEVPAYRLRAALKAYYTATCQDQGALCMNHLEPPASLEAREMRSPGPVEEEP